MMLSTSATYTSGAAPVNAGASWDAAASSAAPRLHTRQTIRRRVVVTSPHGLHGVLGGGWLRRLLPLAHRRTIYPKSRACPFVTPPPGGISAAPRRIPPVPASISSISSLADNLAGPPVTWCGHCFMDQQGPYTGGHLALKRIPKENDHDAIDADCAVLGAAALDPVVRRLHQPIRARCLHGRPRRVADRRAPADSPDSNRSGARPARRRVAAGLGGRGGVRSARHAVYRAGLGALSAGDLRHRRGTALRHRWIVPAQLALSHQAYRRGVSAACRQPAERRHNSSSNCPYIQASPV